MPKFFRVYESCNIKPVGKCDNLGLSYLIRMTLLQTEELLKFWEYHWSIIWVKIDAKHDRQF